MATPTELLTTQRVLITGANGFTGQYLAALLTGRGFAVSGATMPPGAPPGAGPSMVNADLRDLPAMRRLVATVQPRFVVHLAAISFVAHDDVEAIYQTNLVGTRNLLQALMECCDPRPISILLASSANVYGNCNVDPIDEEVPARPGNDYAISKLAMEHVAALWEGQLPITIVRPFNYTGVGQSTSFLIPKIVDAFRRRAKSIELGNLAIERDFMDVRDVIEAYARILCAAPGGVFNVCSGEATSLTAVVRLAEECSGHTLQVCVNPALVRANDIARLRGSCRKLQQLIPHWSPRPLRETVAWMLN